MPAIAQSQVLSLGIDDMIVWVECRNITAISQPAVCVRIFINSSQPHTEWMCFYKFNANCSLWQATRHFNTKFKLHHCQLIEAHKFEQISLCNSFECTAVRVTTTSSIRKRTTQTATTGACRQTEKNSGSWLCVICALPHTATRFFSISFVRILFVSFSWSSTWTKTKPKLNSVACGKLQLDQRTIRIPKLKTQNALCCLPDPNGCVEWRSVSSLAQRAQVKNTSSLTAQCRQCK